MARSRAGAVVWSDVSSLSAAAETSATARSNAASLACDGLLKPDSLRTNCSAEALISSSLAGGSKLNSVLMLRHIIYLAPFILSLPVTALKAPLPKDDRTRKLLHCGPF